MSLGGSYFSELLLMSIFALASSRLASKSEDRSLTRGGELFMDRVRALLLIEMSAEKPKIPTIQALLVLAGRQCSHGKVSEGWLYTGMVSMEFCLDSSVNKNIGHTHDERCWIALESEQIERFPYP